MDINAEMEGVFSPIADEVWQFAIAHKLRLDKCPRGNSGWELTGPHTVGGEITLLLLYDVSAGLGIGSVWQYPCAEMSLLYSHFRPLRAVPIEAEEVAGRLTAELQQLSGVPFGYWTHIRPLTPDRPASK